MVCRGADEEEQNIFTPIEDEGQTACQTRRQREENFVESVRKSKRIKAKQEAITTRTNGTKVSNPNSRESSISENKEVQVIVESEEGTMASETELSQLIKLLTLKIQKEEEEKNTERTSAANFEKIISDFDGRTISFERWMENFQKNCRKASFRKIKKCRITRKQEYAFRFWQC